MISSRILWLGVLAVATPLLLTAQYRLPAGELARLPTVELPAQNNISLLSDELEARKPGRANRFAVALPVSVRPATAGRWTTENGTAVWRTRIYSPGANSLNLGFSEYHLPAGAKLFLLSPGETYGPFSAADNEDHNQLWTPLLEGDELVVELRVPAAVREEVQLHLTYVNHDFQGISKTVSGACNLDVICGEADGWGIVDGYRDVIRSVAAYTINGTDVCTGFLVNNVNQDGKPFFMTANHCGVRADNAPALVAYWNFESNVCRQPGSAASGQLGFGQRNVFNSGAISLADWNGSDASLLLLDDPVNPIANVFFAGWDAHDALPSDTTVAVHHPGVDEKRISFSFNQTYRTNSGGAPPDPDGNLLEVPDWSIGTTEGGSSGSPIFDVTGHVRGQLFGGRAACGNDAYDVYGYFPVSWEGNGTPETSLKGWLDPCNTGTRRIDGLDYDESLLTLAATANCADICAGSSLRIGVTVGLNYPAGTVLSISGPGVLSTSLSATTVTGGDYVELNIDTPTSLPQGDYTLAVTATSAAGSDDAEIRLSAASGPAVAPGQNNPAAGETGVPPNPTLRWTDEEGATSFQVQLSGRSDFSSLLLDRSSVAETSLNVTRSLSPNTVYYWRVRSFNFCGAGAWASSSFTTGDQVCAVERGNGLPVFITPSAAATVDVTLNSTTTGSVQGMEVRLRIDHTFVGDLAADLTGPGGTTVRLFDAPLNGICGGANIDVLFSDAAAQTATDFTNSCEDTEMAISGLFQPAEPFAVFTDGSVTGEWILTVRDNAGQDGGNIVAFEVSFCGSDVVGTQDFGNDRTLSVYPNPARDLLTVEAAGNWPGQLRGDLYDASGRFVTDYRLNNGGRTELPVEDLAAGVYYLRLSGTGQQRTERVVILR